MDTDSVNPFAEMVRGVMEWLNENGDPRDVIRELCEAVSESLKARVVCSGNTPPLDSMMVGDKWFGVNRYDVYLAPLQETSRRELLFVIKIPFSGYPCRVLDSRLVGGSGDVCYNREDLEVSIIKMIEGGELEQIVRGFGT